MSDTVQDVQWNVAYKCPLRGEEEWSNERLSTARYFGPSIYLSRHETGPCVISTTTFLPGGQRSEIPLPESGLFANEMFEDIGGVAGLATLCTTCPVNAEFAGFAGCGGRFSAPHSIYSKELDEKLRAAVHELKLEAAIERVFPRTSLLWFAFWMDSPLSRPAMEILQVLLPGLKAQFGRRSSSFHQDIVKFGSALKIALEHDMPLHVKLSPPGHDDMGWLTTFAHCPRCKAIAPVERWKKIKHFQHVCTVCGWEYDPADTYKRVPDDWEPIDKDLRQLLGDEGYRTFALEYLFKKGASPEDATTWVNQYLAPPDPSILERQKRAEELFEAKLQFMRTVLFEGCTRLQEDHEPEHTLSFSYLLDQEQVWPVLKRCEDWGVSVQYVEHFAEIDDNPDAKARRVDHGSAAKAVQHLIAQGFDKYFSLTINISNEVVEKWQSLADNR